VVRVSTRLAALAAALALASCGRSGGVGVSVPRLDHVIVVVMENRGYDEARTAPYIATLVARGASFSRSYAITHPSQPNYLALWSGSTQGVTNDGCPASGAPFATENLGHACETSRVEWRAYCEDLPSPGFGGCLANNGAYVRRHAPWTNFRNVDPSRERPYADLATDLAAGRLPRLAFVIPNTCDDMHSCGLAAGDAWLSHEAPAWLAAVGPRGVVVLTWDERDSGTDNHILTVIAGGPVRAGVVSARPITHYTLLRTLCEGLGLPIFGGAVHERAIDDVWDDAKATAASRAAP
jgi:phosphatidylinositol-3-phosphatase